MENPHVSKWDFLNTLLGLFEYFFRFELGLFEYENFQIGKILQSCPN